jgi:DNA-binding NtrC family response regulator
MSRHNPHANAVLVVEDEFLIRQYTANAFEDSGFEVSEARNAEEALRILEQNPDVDVLFTDINMPGKLNGLDLAYEVARRWPHVNRVVTSGRVDRGPLDDDITYVEKPYEPEKVAENIRRLLRTRHH